MMARQGAGEQRAPPPSSQDTPPAWPIKMKLREVARLYEEYHRGIDGAPALVDLEARFGKRWRRKEEGGRQGYPGQGGGYHREEGPGYRGDEPRPGRVAGTLAGALELLEEANEVEYVAKAPGYEVHPEVSRGLVDQAVTFDGYVGGRARWWRRLRRTGR